MNSWTEFIAYIIAAFIVIGIPAVIIIKITDIIKSIKYRNTKPPIETITAAEAKIHSNTYSKEYQKKFLLTKNEWFEWKKLKQYCDEKGYLICPKVRLLDLIEPRAGSGYMSKLGKIQSKHVDFVICNTKMYVLGVIELDDNSHNREDRIERDAFVDDVLRGVGYKVHRTRSITENTLNFLTGDKDQSTTETQNGM